MVNALLGSIFLAQAAEPVSVGTAIGLGIVMTILIIVVALCVSGIFIHVAAGFTGIAQTFGTAVSAVLWQILFGFLFAILFGILGALLLPVAPALPFISQWLAITMGIKQAYGTDFLKALVTGIIAFVLTLVVMVVFLFVLALVGLFSFKSLPTNLQPEAMPTQGVEWRAAPGWRELAPARAA